MAGSRSRNYSAPECGRVAVTAPAGSLGGAIACGQLFRRAVPPIFIMIPAEDPPPLRVEKQDVALKEGKGSCTVSAIVSPVATLTWIPDRQ